MKYIIFYLIMISSLISQAQSGDLYSENKTSKNELSLVLIHKNYGNKITLRWAPTREDGWIVGMKNGYRIDRLELNKNMEPTGDWDTLYTKLIKPYSIDRFKQEIAKNKSDNYLITAAESLYGYQMEHGNKNTGGNLFKLAEEFKERFTLCLISADLSSDAAKGLGWSFTDTRISPNKLYMYRVFVPGNDTLSYYMDNSIIAKYDSSTLEYPKISKLLEKEKQIDILLDREINDRSFTAYYIERSSDKGINWSRLNKIPFVQPLTDQDGIGSIKHIVYRDTGLVNYVPYLYRVSGINAFGELSKPSPPLEGMAKDHTPPRSPDRMKVFLNDKKQMEISWEYDNKPSDIRGYILGKSKRPYDPMQPIHEGELNPSINNMIDKSPYTMSSNYYTLFVIDTAGNVSYGKSTFGTFVDEEPPLPPKNLKYKIDTNGIVKIWWNMGKEKDIMGYHVYFNNDRNHYLHNVTKSVLQDTFFIDTLDLRSLSETAYYRITALDINYNVSGYSTWLEVKKPDLVPPSSPLIVSHKASKNGIKFNIKKSSSTDVVAYELLRSINGEKWKSVNWLRASAVTNQITDNKNLVQGKLYKYKLIAIDDAKNKSKVAYIYTARTKLPTLIGSIEKLELKSEKNKVKINWQFIGRNNDVMKLYRSTTNNKFKLIHSYKASQQSGLDYNINKNQSYTYRLVLQSKKGKILDKKDKIIKL